MPNRSLSLLYNTLTRPYVSEMAAFYRKAMKTVYENLPEDMIFQDIQPISIVKLLMHFCLVNDLKAKLIQDDTETETIPDNWYDSKHFYYYYTRNGRIYSVNFQQVSNESDRTHRHILILHEEADDSELISIPCNFPGNCSEERARIDEARIKGIIAELVTGLRNYIEKIESGNFTPRTDFNAE